jgi:signal transduction histidine kinase
VSREINSHLSIEEVLTSVTQKARVLLGAEVASLCLLDADGKILSLHAAAAPEIAIQGNQSPASDPNVGKILHQHCAHPCGLQSKQGFCQIIAPSYRTSHLAAPLYGKENVTGALCVGSSASDAFRPEMATVLAQLADVAAVALENSRLYQQSEYVATLEERQRIAAEMHDGLLQTLSFLRLMVGLLEEQLREGNPEKALDTIQQIQRAEDQSEREIRQAIDSLQDDYPLNDTLQDRLSALAVNLSTTQPPVTFTSLIIRPLLLSRQESEQVLRVAREAILNAQRHSQAAVITMTLEKCDKELVVSVEDHGIGFVPGTDPEDGRAHFGLKIMHARTARLGGRLFVQSRPGMGTVIQLCWVPGYASGADEGL